MPRISSSSEIARWPPDTRKTGARTPSTPRPTSAAEASGFGWFWGRQKWWRREDSNLRHGAYETPALPPELRRRAGGPSRKVTGLRGRRQASVGHLRGQCARKCARQAPSDVLEICRAHNVVAIKDRARSVTGHPHGDAFRDPGVDHIADRRPPEVMPQHPRAPGRPAGRQPGLPEVFSPFSEHTRAPPTYGCHLHSAEVREHPRDDPAQALLKSVHADELGCKGGLEDCGQVYHAPLVVLRRARLQAERRGLEVHLTTLEREHLGLHPPPERVGDAHGDL